MWIDKNNHLVRVEAGEKLFTVEEYLQEQGYTLGFLPMCNTEMTLADYLVEQNNVDLSKIVQGIEWRLPNGEVFASVHAPHYALGFDVKYALLKSQSKNKKKLGELVNGRLYIYPLEQLAAVAFLFSSQAKAQKAIVSVQKKWLNPFAVFLFRAEDFPFFSPGYESSKGFVVIFFLLLYPPMQKDYLERARDISYEQGGELLPGEISENFFNERFSYNNLKNLYFGKKKSSPETRKTTQHFLQRVAENVSQSMP